MYVFSLLGYDIFIFSEADGNNLTGKTGQPVKLAQPLSI
jgi:hypothetical protein